jgi:ATP-dependent RNA helicase DDX35
MDEQELGDGGGFIASSFKPSSLLPIARYRESLLYTVEIHSVTIVVGQTGSGKTTQLPQYLYQAGWAVDGKTIAVTQVRFIRMGFLNVDV